MGRLQSDMLLASVMGYFKPLTKTEERLRCEACFKKACGLLSGRDVIEEFISAGVSPLGRDEFPEFDFKDVKLEYVDEHVAISTFELVRCEGEDDEALVARVENTMEVLVGPYTEKEHHFRLAIMGNYPRLNRVFEFAFVSYKEQDDCLMFDDRKKNKDGKISGRGRGRRKQVSSNTTVVRKKLKVIVIEEEDEDVDVDDPQKAPLFGYFDITSSGKEGP